MWQQPGTGISVVLAIFILGISMFALGIIVGRTIRPRIRRHEARMTDESSER